MRQTESNPHTASRRGPGRSLPGRVNPAQPGAGDRIPRSRRRQAPPDTGRSSRTTDRSRRPRPAHRRRPAGPPSPRRPAAPAASAPPPWRAGAPTRSVTQIGRPAPLQDPAGEVLPLATEGVGGDAGAGRRFEHPATRAGHAYRGGPHRLPRGRCDTDEARAGPPRLRSPAAQGTDDRPGGRVGAPPASQIDVEFHAGRRRNRGARYTSGRSLQSTASGTAPAARRASISSCSRRLSPRPCAATAVTTLPMAATGSSPAEVTQGRTRQARPARNSPFSSTTSCQSRFASPKRQREVVGADRSGAPGRRSRDSTRAEQPAPLARPDGPDDHRHPAANCPRREAECTPRCADFLSRGMPIAICPVSATDRTLPVARSASDDTTFEALKMQRDGARTGRRGQRRQGGKNGPRARTAPAEMADGTSEGGQERWDSA